MQHHELASTNMITKLSQLSTAKPECSIYRVHDHLRNVNAKAYEPEIIAIGPYHRDKANLIMMEEHKLRYFQLIVQGNDNHVEEFLKAIKPLEQEARKCYAEPVNLGACQFVDMLVLDGCFIIELFRKYNMAHMREKNDPIFQMDWILGSLQRDLMLFENQIPFFVLRRLFDLIEVPDQLPRLIHLALSYFHSMNPGKRPERQRQGADTSRQEIKHLLELMHNTWYHLPDLPGPVETAATRKRLKFIDCATRLRDANVKFKVNENATLFDISFQEGTTVLPPLIVEDKTESLFRNMIAYEQYFQDKESSCLTDYVTLLDCLIDSPNDVEILREEIIDNWLGNNEVVANMFKQITESVTSPSRNFIYAKIFDEVNLHCKKRRNKWMSKLRQNYLNSPWAIISILVAFVILLLTLIQAVCSVLQV